MYKILGFVAFLAASAFAQNKLITPETQKVQDTLDQAQRAEASKMDAAAKASEMDGPAPTAPQVETAAPSTPKTETAEDRAHADKARQQMHDQLVNRSKTERKHKKTAQ